MTVIYVYRTHNLPSHLSPLGTETKSGYVSMATFWIVVVVEFVVIMLVVLVTIDALRCRRKKEGVLHKVNI